MRKRFNKVNMKIKMKTIKEGIIKNLKLFRDLVIILIMYIALSFVILSMLYVFVHITKTLSNAELMMMNDFFSLTFALGEIGFIICSVIIPWIKFIDKKWTEIIF